jgi:hypothetical protein
MDRLVACGGSGQERAALFGGWLWVRSGPGIGTTVEFWIPEFSEQFWASAEYLIGASAPSEW